MTASPATSAWNVPKITFSTASQGVFLSAPPLYVNVAQTIRQQDIVETTRIGVDYAGEWVNKPWRFYLKGNRFVSIK